MRLRCGLTAAILCLTTSLSAQGSRVADWRADIDSLAARIVRIHPRPWAHITPGAFTRRVAALRATLGARTDAEILAELMRITALLEDGHTALTDLGPAAGTWYPLRLQLYADGLWITAITPEQARFAGARVLALGSVSADTAVARIVALTSGDNALGRREGVANLANALLLRALKISSDDSLLPLQTDRGSLTLKAVRTGKGDVSWWQFGEMFGPAGIPLVTAFGGRDGPAYRDPAKNLDLPLHLRGRRAYWWTVLPADSTVYFALNSVTGQSSFSQFTLLQELGQAVAHVDSAPAATTRFILDLRYNSGGNGALTHAIVNQFVRREASIGRRGRFFVITGRKTFSAAAGTVFDLLDHTSPVLVGEPMGVAFNSSGDPATSTLPRHGINLIISTRSTLTSTLDSIRMVPVQVPATMTGVDYFAGRDPALAAILAAPAPYPEVLGTLEERGAAAARELWQTQRARFGGIAWWQPFTWGEMNDLAYRLLEGKRTADAIAGFELNTECYPARWDAWDSLGDGYREAGRRGDAVAAYGRALKLAPDNWNAAYQKRMLKELSGPPG